MINWRLIESELPERGIDIILRDDDNTIHRAYLCNCCGNEWRDTQLGMMLMISPKWWTSISEFSDAVVGTNLHKCNTGDIIDDLIEEESQKIQSRSIDISESGPENIQNIR